jgi:hypothetical protein
MASHGSELLGERYGKDRLTHEEMKALGLKPVTEDGEEIGQEEMRGRVFRVEDPDDASG